MYQTDNLASNWSLRKHYNESKMESVPPLGPMNVFSTSIFNVAGIPYISGIKKKKEQPRGQHTLDNEHLYYWRSSGWNFFLKMLQDDWHLPPCAWFWSEDHRIHRNLAAGVFCNLCALWMWIISPCEFAFCLQPLVSFCWPWMQSHCWKVWFRLQTPLRCF